MLNRPNAPGWAAAAAFALVALGFAAPANATLFVDALVGGAPTGVIYENFDGLPAGNTGGVTSTGITVSFDPDGQAVTGSLSGQYAAPFISNSNGVPFGDPTVSGPDTTQYLTTGLGSVTLELPSNMKYAGWLWGSVDDYNTVEFYLGNTLVGSLNGLDIDAAADGDQGADGTFYVNVNSDTAFNKLVYKSEKYAKEFDNFAMNASRTDVSEPATFALFGAGLIGLGFARKRLPWQRRRSA